MVSSTATLPKSLYLRTLPEPPRGNRMWDTSHTFARHVPGGRTGSQPPGVTPLQICRYPGEAFKATDYSNRHVWVPRGPGLRRFCGPTFRSFGPLARPTDDWVSFGSSNSGSLRLQFCVTTCEPPGEGYNRLRISIEARSKYTRFAGLRIAA